MKRKPAIDDLKKRLRVRKYVWILGLTILLLIDEYLKEGYVFNKSDILTYGTHEFIILFLLLSLILSLVLDVFYKRE